MSAPIPDADLPPRRIPRLDRLAQLADYVEAIAPDAPYPFPQGFPAGQDQATRDFYGITGDDTFAMFYSNTPRTGAEEAAIVREVMARYDPANLPTWDEWLRANGAPHDPPEAGDWPYLRLEAAEIDGEWRAAFAHAFVTDRVAASRFYAADGRGPTRDAAILDYQRAISGRMLAVSFHTWEPLAKDGSKRLIEVPYWPALFDGANAP